ncbi:MAG TPA: hypothetical protein VKZ53_12115 [Candidatus Angelobacter sp.]|nr:hypothetical protein [Candidatus Angelobacter sp.]
MENYFNYFTEIEEHFQRRRGTVLLLSTLDWALIDTWKEAGIPLEAALRGIDSTFDAYERKPSKTKKINGLAYCSQEVLAAAEEAKEAALGTRSPEPSPGMDPGEIVKFMQANGEKLRRASVPEQARSIVNDCASTLDGLAQELGSKTERLRTEELERHLTILEEKLLAALTVTTSETALIAVRAEADREIAPYRSKMPTVQIERLHRQFVHKRLMEQAGIPRLSLFYM